MLFVKALVVVCSLMAFGAAAGFYGFAITLYVLERAQ